MSQSDTQDVKQLIINYANEQQKSFKTMKSFFEELVKDLNLNLTYRQLRGYFTRYNEVQNSVNRLIRQNTQINVSGLTTSTISNLITAESVFNKLEVIWNDEIHKEELAASNTVEINTDQPIAVVAVADQHFGGGIGTATDIRRIFDEAKLMANTPNLYLAHNGDLSNNFIGEWTANLNNNRQISIKEEAVISLEYMKIIQDILVAWVTGNHNYWTEKYTGFSANYEMLMQLKNKQSILFDDDELNFRVKTSFADVGFLMRHIWRGNTSTNLTGGIERAAKLNNIYDSTVYIGAHIHSGGIIKEFINAGKTNYALLCGTYKKIDHYSRQNGFFKANDSTAVGVVIHPKFGIMPFSNLYALCDYMKWA